MPITHVGLSINVGSEPIQGSVATEGQEPKPFHGWVELAAAIEAVSAVQTPELDRTVDAGSH